MRFRGESGVFRHRVERGDLSKSVTLFFRVSVRPSWTALRYVPELGLLRPTWTTCDTVPDLGLLRPSWTTCDAVPELGLLAIFRFAVRLTGDLRCPNWGFLRLTNFVAPSLAGTHRPSIPFTDRRPLYHIEDLCIDGIHQPLDNRRVEWLVKSKLLDAFHFLAEYGLPIPLTKLGQKTWPARGTLGYSNGIESRAGIEVLL